MLSSLLLATLAGSTVFAANIDLAACQKPRQQGHQLDNCPKGTLYVSQSDKKASFTSINAALATLPNDNSTQYVLIGGGTYHEVVNITRKAPLRLLGMTSNPVDLAANQVAIWNASFTNQTGQAATDDNADSSVFTVSPNRAASLVGSGPLGAPLQPEFGSVDFRAYNLNVSNRAEVNGVEVLGKDTGPSAALFVAYANASFYGCTFSSYQDTLYVGRNASAFFAGGIVRGSTDFLYGFGTAMFRGVTLMSRGVGGGLVAWKGSEQWYGPNNFGAYIIGGSVVVSDDVLPSLHLTGQRALGRPWNNQSRVIYDEVYMSDIVLPAGFIQWSKTDPRVFPNVTHFIESASYGPGWNATARASNSLVQSVVPKDEGRKLTSVQSVFGEKKPRWIDEGRAKRMSKW